MRRSKHWVALILGCALIAPAHAQPGSGRVGEVRFKNEAAGTLTIDERTYSVTEATRIRDREGRSLSLAAMNAPQQGERGLWEMLHVRYGAVETNKGVVLTFVEILRTPE